MRAFLAASVARLKFRLLCRLARWCGLPCLITARAERSDALIMAAFAIDQRAVDECFIAYAISRQIREAVIVEDGGDPVETESLDRPVVH